MPIIDSPPTRLAAVTAAIRGVIEDDRFPHAPRLDPLRAALARLDAAQIANDSLSRNGQAAEANPGPEGPAASQSRQAEDMMTADDCRWIVEYLRPRDRSRQTAVLARLVHESALTNEQAKTLLFAIACRLWPAAGLPSPWGKTNRQAHLVHDGRGDSRRPISVTRQFRD